MKKTLLLLACAALLAGSDCDDGEPKAIAADAGKPAAAADAGTKTPEVKVETPVITDAPKEDKKAEAEKKPEPKDKPSKK